MQQAVGMAVQAQGVWVWQACAKLTSLSLPRCSTQQQGMDGTVFYFPEFFYIYLSKNTYQKRFPFYFFI